jgi:hypothetical protein
MPVGFTDASEESRNPKDSLRFEKRFSAIPTDAYYKFFFTFSAYKLGNFVCN